MMSFRIVADTPVSSANGASARADADIVAIVRLSFRVRSRWGLHRPPRRAAIRIRPPSASILHPLRLPAHRRDTKQAGRVPPLLGNGFCRHTRTCDLMAGTPD